MDEHGDGARAPWASPALPQSHPTPQPPWGPADPPANGFAVASFVLSLFALIPVSVVFGVIGLQTARLTRRGKGLAVAGLVMSLVWATAGLVSAGVVIGRASDSARPTASRPVAANRPVNQQPGYLGLALEGDLKVGDCLQLPAAVPAMASTFVEIDCSKPHNGEVFTVSSLPWAKTYPGTSSVETKVMSTCRANLHTFLGSSAYTSLRVRYFYPTATSWSFNQDYVCMVHVADHQVTGTLKGTGPGGST